LKRNSRRKNNEEEEGKGMGKDDIFEELKDIIGPEAAKRLIDHYSGSNVYYPKRIWVKRQHRQIRDEFKNGASYGELAARYEYTESYIRRIVHNKEV
jgi:Mor family transcriptional regulator